MPLPLQVRYAAINDFKLTVLEISVYGLTPREGLCQNNCSRHGNCIVNGAAGAWGTCTCVDGYTGSDCSIPGCGSAGCGLAAHGTCVRGSCVCAPGAWGPGCNKSTPCLRDCWGHGTCLRGLCSCDAGFGGGDCRYMVYTNSSEPRNLVAWGSPYKPPPPPPLAWRGHVAAAVAGYNSSFAYTGNGHWATSKAASSKTTLPPLESYAVHVSSTADFFSLSGGAVARLRNPSPHNFALASYFAPCPPSICHFSCCAGA